MAPHHREGARVETLHLLEQSLDGIDVDGVGGDAHEIKRELLEVRLEVLIFTAPSG